MTIAGRRCGLPKNDLISSFLSIFQAKSSPESSVFKDGMGNFEIKYPKDWKHDKDIAIVDGKYAVSFESRGGKQKFCVSIDASLPKRFDFAEYVHSELEGPASGICCDLKRSRFRGMPSYKREYVFTSGGVRYLAGGLIFHPMNLVFSISWSAPENDKQTQEIFEKMIRSLAIKGSISRGVA